MNGWHHCHQYKVECRVPNVFRFIQTRDFSPRVNFQSRLSLTCVRTPPCAIACINIHAHVKNPVVYVRVRWIMEILQHPACTVGWVARLCRSWLSPGKATRISHGRNPAGTIQFDFKAPDMSMLVTGTVGVRECVCFHKFKDLHICTSWDKPVWLI